MFMALYVKSITYKNYKCTLTKNTGILKSLKAQLLIYSILYLLNLKFRYFLVRLAFNSIYKLTTNIPGKCFKTMLVLTLVYTYTYL